MKKTYEDDTKIIYENDFEVRTESKSGGTITTLKHDLSWHDTAPPWLKESPCKFCTSQKNVTT